MPKKDYKLDWDAWDAITSPNGVLPEPHITLRDGRILRIINVGSMFTYNYILQILTASGWSDLRQHNFSLNERRPEKENNVIRNKYIYDLMRYAEYLFAGLNPGVEQSNNYPKWEFYSER